MIFIHQHCFQQSLPQMMTLGSGMVLGPEALLPLTQSAPAITHDTTRLCWIDVTLWDCYIHSDAVRALFWMFFYAFPLV